MTSPYSRACLITGTTEGLGKALLRSGLASGWRLLAIGNSGCSEDGLLSERDLDITEPGVVDRFLAEAAPGHIDCVINNAAVFPDPDIGLERLDAEQVLRAVEINAVGALRVLQAAAPWLRRSAKPGIVNISSTMGSLSSTQKPGSYGYRMSKAALNMLSVALAAEFPAFRILTLHPGHLMTRMGGPLACLEPARSAEAIWRLIDSTLPSGFYDHLGQPLDW
jgi:NAD(P)-dependent dehydrogenase (short-subunit alcohol dehydrogenase family)